MGINAYKYQRGKTNTDECWDSIQMNINGVRPTRTSVVNKYGRVLESIQTSIEKVKSTQTSVEPKFNTNVLKMVNTNECCKVIGSTRTSVWLMLCMHA